MGNAGRYGEGGKGDNRIGGMSNYEKVFISCIVYPSNLCKCIDIICG